jgi:hypothetical protein
VARTEAETAAKKRAERGKRYAKKFYLADGLALYDALAIAQDFKCGACGRPFSDFSISMNIDHEHFKVRSSRFTPTTPPYGKWMACTEFKDGRNFVAFADTQKAAIELLKRRATPHSIRGLLCPGRYTGCNRLMGRIDKIEWLEKVLAYLKNPPIKKVLELQANSVIESQARNE